MIKFKSVLLLLLSMLFLGQLSAQTPAAEDQLFCGKAASQVQWMQYRGLNTFEDLSYDLKYFRFEWVVDPAINAISGTVTPYFTAVNNGIQTLEFNLSTAFTIDAVKYHGANIQYTKSGDFGLTIQLPSALASGTLDSLSITYHGTPPPTGFGSFIQADHNGSPIIWTLSEPFGAQDWWPCKNGLTDKVDSIDVLVKTNAQYRAASNGLLVSETTSGSDKIYHWKHRYPIAPYLVAIAVTNYVQYTDIVTLGNGIQLPMLNYVYPEDLANAESGTADLVQVLEFYDSLFVSYPFANEKYGHAQFSWGGGMEHQTMSFVASFNWGLLAHELAHQWFGDMITCGSWEDIWLNEGFATFLEGLSRERFQPGADWWNWRQGKVSNITSQPGGSVMVDDTTSVGRIFSGRLSYQKGAYLLHMLRWKLGDNAFFTGVRNYLNDRQYQYAKTPSLIAHLETASGEDLTEFFADWYSGQGFPSYQVTWSQNNQNQLRVTINQTTSHPSVSFFEMPVPIEFSGASQESLLRFEHTQQGQEFIVDLPFAVSSVVIDPDLWLVSANNTVSQVSDAPTATEAPLRFEVTPNPARERCMVELDLRTASVAKLVLIDQAGKLVWSSATDLQAGSNRVPVEFGNLPAGTYIFQANGGNWSVQKLISIAR